MDDSRQEEKLMKLCETLAILLCIHSVWTPQTAEETLQVFFAGFNPISFYGIVWA